MHTNLMALTVFGSTAAVLALLLVWLVWIAETAYPHGDDPVALEFVGVFACIFTAVAVIGTVIAYIVCLAEGQVPLWTLVVPAGGVLRAIVDITRWAKKKGATR